MADEPNHRGRSASASSKEPPKTDLEYFALPENYETISLLGMQRMKLAKEREEMESARTHSPKIKAASPHAFLYNRYRDTLKDCGLPDSEWQDKSSPESATEEEMEGRKEDIAETTFDEETPVGIAPKKTAPPEDNKISPKLPEVEQKPSKHVADKAISPPSTTSEDIATKLKQQLEDHQQKFVPRQSELLPIKPEPELSEIVEKSTETAENLPTSSTIEKSLSQLSVEKAASETLVPTVFTSSDKSSTNSSSSSETSLMKSHSAEKSSSGHAMEPHVEMVEETKKRTSPSGSREARMSTRKSETESIRSSSIVSSGLSSKPRSKHLLHKPLKRTVVLVKFQRLVRKVNAIRYLIICLVEKHKARNMREDESKLATFIAMASNRGQESQKKTNTSGVVFDVTAYRAKREITISNEVKLILMSPKHMRTPEQIQTAMYGLQSLRSFAEYPLHMQEKLCRVAWYNVVAPNRVIIRQGHVAEFFYFILAGSAVVTIVHQDAMTGENVVRTASVLRRGMSFGELALLHHSRRTATVTSNEEVQLLTIGRDDFFDIFMKVELGPGGMPDHIRFLSQMEFMQNWPVHRLLETPDMCLYHFFKRNTLMVQSSTTSEWIYVVRTGCCQVIKQLRGVIPRLRYSRKDPALSGEPPFPKIGVQTFAPKIDTNLENLRKRKSLKPLISVHLAHDVEGYLRHLQKTKQPAPPDICNINISIDEVTGKESEEDFQDSGDRPRQSSLLSLGKSDTNNERVFPTDATKISEASKEIHNAPTFRKARFNRRRILLLRQRRRVADPQTTQPRRHKPPALSPIRAGKQKGAVEDSSTYETIKVRRESIKRRSLVAPVITGNFKDPFAAAPFPQPSPPDKERYSTTHLIRPVFVQIELLKPRDVFGLDTVQFFDSSDTPGTDVSLVSRGTECILLSKAFFMKHANEDVKRRVQRLGRVYPDEETLQANLQIKADWELYKKSLIEDFAAHNPLKRCAQSRST